MLVIILPMNNQTKTKETKTKQEMASQKSCNNIRNGLKIFKRITKETIFTMCIYIFWAVIHYICARLYPIYCAPSGFLGFLSSLVMTQAPHCIALRYGIQYGSSLISSMWITIGTWIVLKLSIKI